MCPRCKSHEVVYWAKCIGTIMGRDTPHSEKEPEVSAIVCNKCGYVMYNLEWGWADDILEKIKQFTELAKQHGVTSPSALYDFLIEMDIPSPYLPGGTYYIHGGDNEQESAIEE